MSTLEIDRLSKTYPGGVRAMEDVSLRLGNGMFGLLGPNGAGKSTLMRTLAGLQAPDAGAVTFDGVDVLARPREIRRRLGYLPQEFGVYPGVSAERLLDHLAVLKGIESRAERREQVGALLELTNLRDARKRAVSTFSGGMKQRFGIAQTLLGRPELIIVDEPTAGLDPEERHRFHHVLHEIGEHVVVLLSTHIVDDVRDLCPRMAILVDGRIVRQGLPADLIRALSGRLWRKRIHRGELEAHRRELPVISSRLCAGTLHVHAVADARPAEGFEAIEPTLEDVYFASLTESRDAACRRIGGRARS